MNTRKLRATSIFGFLVPILLANVSLSAHAASLKELSTLSLEEFSNLDVVVTSLSRKPQKLTKSPAAIYVISNEDIKRSGANSIPEALRLAPGIEVAQINASNWAITSRGFNGRFANKLLVLMDGRTLYTPMFSGVYWDAQDTLLEDIERIEVIRGPATAVWGGNAMNGVINIITKQSSDTQGGLLVAGAGTEQRGLTGFRYGGTIGETVSYRAHGKYKKIDSSVNGTDTDDSFDNWDSQQLGFRVDWKPSDENAFNFYGNIYQNTEEQRQATASLVTAPLFDIVEADQKIKGFSLHGKWHHQVSADANWSVQTYFDRAERKDTATLDMRVDTFDLEFKNQFTLADRHKVIWGLGYRRIKDELDGSATVSYTSDSRTLHRYNAFIQDEIALYKDTLSLFIGSQFEHNDFSGFEAQPNIRLLWNIDSDSSAWASISKGLRVQNRSSEDARVDVSATTGAPPILVSFMGTDDAKPGKVIAYEMGYRTFFGGRNLFDVSLFYNDYSRLRSNELGTPFVEFSPAPVHVVQPLIGGYNKKGESYGIEVAAKWDVSPEHSIQTTYSFFKLRLHAAAGSTSPSPEQQEGISPNQQASLRSSYKLTDKLTLDSSLRYVDGLPNLDINHYTDLDIQLTWEAQPDLELSLAGRNLLDGARTEYIEQNISTAHSQIERELFAKLLYRF
jgi:iron complex outermembrane receptor protein